MTKPTADWLCAGVGIALACLAAFLILSPIARLFERMVEAITP